MSCSQNISAIGNGAIGNGAIGNDSAKNISNNREWIFYFQYKRLEDYK